MLHEFRCCTLQLHCSVTLAPHRASCAVSTKHAAFIVFGPGFLDSVPVTGSSLRLQPLLLSADAADLLHILWLLIRRAILTFIPHVCSWPFTPHTSMFSNFQRNSVNRKQYLVLKRGFLASIYLYMKGVRIFCYTEILFAENKLTV